MTSCLIHNIYYSEEVFEQMKKDFYEKYGRVKRQDYYYDSTTEPDDSGAWVTFLFLKIERKKYLLGF